jgi:hypothetical protein
MLWDFVTLLYITLFGIPMNSAEFNAINNRNSEVWKYKIQDSFKQAQPGKTHLLGNGWARKCLAPQIRYC